MLLFFGKFKVYFSGPLKYVGNLSAKEGQPPALKPERPSLDLNVITETSLLKRELSSDLFLTYGHSVGDRVPPPPSSQPLSEQLSWLNSAGM